MVKGGSLTAAFFLRLYRDQFPDMNNWVRNCIKAISRRGLNFVIYDNEVNNVIDSVCFDTFSERYGRVST